MRCFAKESTKEENDGGGKKKDNIKTKQIVPFIFPPFPRLLKLFLYTLIVIIICCPFFKNLN